MLRQLWPLHRAMLAVLELAGTQFDHGTVFRLNETTFGGAMWYRLNEQWRNINVLPGDAIALALRSGVRILVNSDHWDVMKPQEQ